MDVTVNQPWKNSMSWFRVGFYWIERRITHPTEGLDLAILYMNEPFVDGLFASKDADVAEEECSHIFRRR